MQYLKKFIINSQLQENNTKNFFGTIFGPLVAIILLTFGFLLSSFFFVYLFYKKLYLK